MTDVRRFEFPAKTQLQQKERTKAVAWATNKVGGWRGSNVTAAIQRYLQDAGFKVDQRHVKYSMEYLVERDLAIAVVVGKRTVEFIMAPDVELEEPDFVKAQRIRAVTHGPELHQNGHVPVVNPAPRRRSAPRLPSAARGPARADELLEALRAWHLDDSAACEQWIEAVLHDLEGT